MKYEIFENEGEVTMRDPASGVALRFVRGEGNTMRGEAGNASASEYIGITNEMTAYAYEQGFLSETDNGKLARQAWRKVLGRQLRDARESVGLSIRDVEERTGISKSIIYRTEAGRANTTIDSIATLADCYGMKIQLIYDNENND